MKMILFYKNQITRGETINSFYQDYTQGKFSFMLNGKMFEIALNTLNKIVIDGTEVYLNPELEAENEKNDVFPF